MSDLTVQAKTKFLEWARSEEGIEVCPDVDMFHAFKEVSGLTSNSRLPDCPADSKTRQGIRETRMVQSVSSTPDKRDAALLTPSNSPLNVQNCIQCGSRLFLVLRTPLPRFVAEHDSSHECLLKSTTAAHSPNARDIGVSLRQRILLPTLSWFGSPAAAASDRMQRVLHSATGRRQWLLRVSLAPRPGEDEHEHVLLIGYTSISHHHLSRTLPVVVVAAVEM